MGRWLLFIALLTGAWLPASAQDIGKLGDFVREPDSLIEEEFGAPDEVVYLESKDAEVWTYFRSGSDGPALDERNEASAPDSLRSGVSDFSLRPIETKRAKAGYRQFAFWNGKVAAVSLLQTGTKADLLYETGRSYLEENAHWVGRLAGSEFAKFTRMGDNLWTVAKQSGENDTQAVIRVGDAGYVQCDKLKESELRRVKAEFSADLQK